MSTNEINTSSGPNEVQCIKAESPPNTIIFHADTEEILRISKEGFFYRGQKVEDAYNVYERFNDWLKQARMETTE